MNSNYFILVILSLILSIVSQVQETPAKCKARCYHENSDCCGKTPSDCGGICFEQSRNCYKACNELKFLDQ